MPRRKTPEEYIKECKDKGLDLPIEDYVNATTKIKHRCNKGHIYKQTPSHHLGGRGCPYCKGLFLKTPEEYIKECKERGYDIPIEDYVNARTKIKHKCSKGHIYFQIPSSHLQGQGCPICYGTKKKTSKEYYNECKDKGLDLPIEDYKGTHIKIKHKCEYNHIYKQKPSNHLNGQRCPICFGNKKKVSNDYYNECKDKGLDLPIEEYKNSKFKIKYKCRKGHTYYQTPSDHSQGHGCPVCKESHGEKFIRNYLDKHDIKFIPQKRFHNLKDKTYLSYDFYLPDYSVLIEYQGQQHYQTNGYFGGKKRFKKQQLHDKLKREYAKNNGYKLLELKYTLDTQDLVNKYLSRRLKD